MTLAEVSHNLEGMINLALPALLVLTAAAAIFIRNLMAATALLGIFSLLMALIYLLLAAPDVAITEAAVGAGVSTVFLLGAISICGMRDGGPSSNLLVPLVVIIVSTAALFYASFDMPVFGDGTAPANAHLGAYFIHVAPMETGIPNAVTSILASYRGYDTLGETCVVFTAAVACMLLLGKDENVEEHQPPDTEETSATEERRS